ncbi:SepM family pheromone-processing serine protease [Metasolibacillus sp.]|uniref:SepM family pheromone-processing serine protease n=1 Tax=Metasolibacillus sp. TaxID=2703680 RepID=UPI0025FBC2BE|nr:SepM family pheromone-processing serine protease [Metasolibacillus sp.]MCT6923997.1 PDZ domain-containing protein [Metasolibacillus sp.]MCT6940145.1 PDZ domain-containing protein [Metasolibacillus sp.]
MKKRLAIIVVALLMFSFLTLYKLDSYIMSPGSAYDVSEFVNVQNGDTEDEGTFNLMTVSMMRATPLLYAVAFFNEHQEIMQLNTVRQKEEDEEEYNIRQLKLMTDSQFNALYVAFSKAGLDYNVTWKGVYVLNVLAGGAAEGIVKAGDEIVEVNGQRIQKQSELVEIISKAQKDDAVELVINRNNELLTKNVQLKEIPDSDGRVGLGIMFTESKSIKTDPKVKINAEDIGGPSAGLMFTLEILNQLLDEDLTKGYAVAGTGEMNEDGTVGRIGGIERKVIAADRDGMEIFFAPDDEITTEMRQYNPKIESNYAAAVKTAEDIGTKMKIVPVKTVDDALAYLQALEPKK